MHAAGYRPPELKEASVLPRMVSHDRSSVPSGAESWKGNSVYCIRPLTMVMVWKLELEDKEWNDVFKVHGTAYYVKISEAISFNYSSNKGDQAL